MVLERISSRIPNGLKYVGIFILAVIILWLGFRLYTGLANPFYVVTTSEMVPRIQFGDTLLVKGTGGGLPLDSLKEGDMIVFHSPAEYDHITVSRIFQIQKDSEGEVVVQTKGDALIGGRDLGGNYPIREKDYIGKVVNIIPVTFSAVFKVIAPPINYIIISGIIIMIFVYYHRKRKAAM